MSANRVIGVDLGGTKILAGLVDAAGNVSSTSERPTPRTSQQELLAALDDAVEDLAADGVQALGVGIPSRIDRRTGHVQGSVNIPLEGLDLSARMRERFGLPVTLENDANAATYGEFRAGAGRDVDSMVMLTLGTGCGGGVVHDGRLFQGWAELGHIVIDEDGPPCQGSCTGVGHLESYVSAGAAARLTHDAFGPSTDVHSLERLAYDGDATALEIVRSIGRHLGAGIATLVNVFAPQLVAIGGGFGAAMADLLIEPAREVVLRQALSPAGETVRIARAELGPSAGIVGAGLLAFDAIGA